MDQGSVPVDHSFLFWVLVERVQFSGLVGVIPFLFERRADRNTFCVTTPNGNDVQGDSQWPGLTGVSEGVITPRKKNLLGLM